MRWREYGSFNVMYIYTIYIYIYIYIYKYTHTHTFTVQYVKCICYYIANKKSYILIIFTVMLRKIQKISL